MAKQVTRTIYTFGELLERKAGQVVISSQAIEKARTHLVRMVTDDGGWFEYLFELWKSALAEIGFEDAKIRFSGFWSQGDGASFTTSNVDLVKLAKYLSTKIEPKNCIEVGEDGKERFAAWLNYKIGGWAATNPKHARIAWLANVAHISIERGTLSYSHEMTCRVHDYLGDRGETVVHSRSKPGESFVEKVVGESCTPRTRALWKDFVEDVEILRRDVSRAIYASLKTDYEAITDEDALKSLSEDQNIYFDPLGRREYE